jgi:hypothetical protein
MTKVFLQPGLRGLSGAMGDWVYQIRNGKTIIGMKALKSGDPSEAQIEQRKRFKEAAAYAKRALANGQRAFYELTAKQKEIPAFALAVADFFIEPTVVSVYSDGYNGQIGDQIVIEASDDCGVVQVKVVLSANQGAWVEEGLAVVDPEGSGDWIYTATEEAPAGAEVTINVSATDRPGGKGLHASQRIINHTAPA